VPANKKIFFWESAMNKCIKSIVTVLTMVTPAASFAAWSSGGGELIKDLHNPWFVQNTKQVTYCIARDAEHFKLNTEEGFPIETLVLDAVKYWKDEFKTAANPSVSGPDGFTVATQDFVHVDCSQDPDISFQFGYLSPAQLAEMKKLAVDPKGFVSLAVRTDYDQVNLKGKGFVYLAADSGPLRPNTDEMLENPWAVGSGSFIYKVLVHELGHVFGVQHQSDYLSVMAPEFPEALVRKPKDGLPVSGGYSYYLPRFFQFAQSKDFWVCMNLEWHTAAIHFYGIPDGWKCYSRRFPQNVQRS
jgi:hypothetical protein